MISALTFKTYKCKKKKEKSDVNGVIIKRSF